MDIGYLNARCSIAADEQCAILAGHGCDRLVEGGLGALLAEVSEGDVVAIAALSVLGAKPRSALRAAAEIVDAGASLLVIGEGIDTSRPEDARFVAHAAAILGVSGDSGKRKGHTGGKPKADPSSVARAVGMYESGGYRVPEILEATGISRSTLYRNIRKVGSGDT